MKKYNPIEFWNKCKHPNSSGRDGWQNFRLKLHSEYIKKNLNGCKKILDFGSGKGQMFYIYDDVGVQTVISYDISESFKKDIIEHGQKFNFNHIHVVRMFLVPEFQDYFKVDAVVCCNVLQSSRFEDIENVLKELYRISDKIICLEHHDNNKSKDYDYIHYRPHNYKKICKNNGWKMINIEYPGSLKQIHFVIV